MLSELIPWKKKESTTLEPRRVDHPIDRLRHDFDSLVDRFWDDWRNGGPGLGRSTFGDSGRWFAGGMELDDREKEYVLHAELPGFEPEDFDVKISGNVLTLRAEHKEEGEDKDGNGNYRRYGTFYQSFTLPRGVLTDQIDARYHSGVLEVHLPKSEECTAKRIEVKAS